MRDEIDFFKDIVDEDIKNALSLEDIERDEVQKSILFIKRKIKRLDLQEAEDFRETCDHYVYEWWDNRVPFYVGKGKGNRAWVQHTGEPCQEIRDRSRKFRVVILEDHLTDETARLLESKYIKLRRLEGKTLVNVSSPEKIKHCQVHRRGLFKEARRERDKIKPIDRLLERIRLKAIEHFREK